MKTAQEQLDQKLIALQKASLELVSDISIDSLLERIAMVACEQGQAGQTPRLPEPPTLHLGRQRAPRHRLAARDEIRRLSRPRRGRGWVGQGLHPQRPRLDGQI